MNPEMGAPDELSRREFFKNFLTQILNGTLSIQQGKKPLEEKSKGVSAQLDISNCLAWGGLICQQCYLACHLRDQAIAMVDSKPVLNIQSCDGCGLCVSACETVNNPASISLGAV